MRRQIVRLDIAVIARDGGIVLTGIVPIICQAGFRTGGVLRISVEIGAYWEAFPM